MVANSDRQRMDVSEETNHQAYGRVGCGTGSRSRMLWSTATSESEPCTTTDTEGPLSMRCCRLHATARGVCSMSWLAEQSRCGLALTSTAESCTQRAGTAANTQHGNSGVDLV
ncbi:unnamed protein product [Ectocarpus fasciculatus]